LLLYDNIISDSYYIFDVIFRCKRSICKNRSADLPGSIDSNAVRTTCRYIFGDDHEI